MLLANGTYRAVVRDNSVFLRGENERLTAAFRLDCEGKELVHREWLELNDGTISDKTVRRLRACFPKWDGTIEMLEQGFCVRDVEVDITVENEPDRDDPEKWWTRTRFMDPPGGSSGGAAMPDKANRASLVGKYGARFRALAGGSPAKTAAGPVSSGQLAGSSGEGLLTTDHGPRTTGPVGSGQLPVGSGQLDARAKRAVAEAPSRAAVPPTPPSARPAKVEPAASTLEECWEELCKKHPDELREQLSERWFALLERTAPGKDQADFSPEDWGAVRGEI